MKKTVYGRVNDDGIGPGCHGNNEDDAGLSSISFTSKVVVIMKRVVIIQTVVMMAVVAEYRKRLRLHEEASSWCEKSIADRYLSGQWTRKRPDYPLTMLPRCKDIQFGQTSPSSLFPS